MLGNYPNPFNPSTQIYYVVENNNSEIKISILDLLGREVSVLYKGIKDKGYHEINWDGLGQSGNKLGSGIYFISASIDKNQRYKKIMKLK